MQEKYSLISMKTYFESTFVISPLSRDCFLATGRPQIQCSQDGQDQNFLLCSPRIQYVVRLYLLNPRILSYIVCSQNVAYRNKFSHKITNGCTLSCIKKVLRLGRRKSAALPKCPTQGCSLRLEADRPNTTCSNSVF